MIKVKTGGRNLALDLTQGSIKSLLIRFAWPFLVAGFINALYGMADMLFIGRYGTEAMLAGVANGAQVMNIMITFIMGFGSAGAVLVGRRVGEKIDSKSAAAVGTFLTFGIILSTVLTICGFIFRMPMVYAIQTPDDAVKYAGEYIIWYLPGLPFHIMYNMLASVARGLGDSRSPSIVGSIGCISNIILDWFFTAIIPWGVMGVALASAIAHVLTLVLMGAWLMHVKFPFKFSKRDLKPNKSDLTVIFKIGIPLWLQELLVSISFMIIAALVNKMGVTAAASVGVVSKIFTLGAIFPSTISSAVAAMSAQNLGAGKKKRAFDSLKWGVIYSLGIELLILIWWQVAPTSMTGLFSGAEDSAVKYSAAAYLRSFSIDLLFVGTVFPINSYLASRGSSFFILIHNSLSTFGARVPLSILFSRTYGMQLSGQLLNDKLFTLGMAAPLASAVSVIMCCIYLVIILRRDKAAMHS